MPAGPRLRPCLALERAAAPAAYSLPPVYVARTAAEAEELLLLHAPPGHVYGLDTESRPTFKAGQVSRTALVQLATPAAVLLLPVCRLGPLHNLAVLLSDAQTVLVGVNVYNDAAPLAELRAATVDLSDVALEGTGGRPLGLATLTSQLGGPLLEKPKRVTMSNWEAPLSELQVQYAAHDAYAGYWVASRLHDESASPLSLHAWLHAKAAVQAQEQTKAALRTAAAVEVLLKCCPDEPELLLARARQLLPRESRSYLSRALDKLVRKKLIRRAQDGRMVCV
jgi:hypothetical protein